MRAPFAAYPLRSGLINILIIPEEITSAAPTSLQIAIENLRTTLTLYSSITSPTRHEFPPPRAVAKRQPKSTNCVTMLKKQSHNGSSAAPAPVTTNSREGSKQITRPSMQIIREPLFHPQRRSRSIPRRRESRIPVMYERRQETRIRRERRERRKIKGEMGRGWRTGGRGGRADRVKAGRREVDRRVQPHGRVDLFDGGPRTCLRARWTYLEEG